MLSFISVLVLPLISLLAGIASLYIDPKTQPKRKWILILLMLMSAAGAVIASYKDDRHQANLENQRSQLDDTIHNLSRKTESINEMDCSILEAMSGSGLPQTTISLMEQSCSADVARAAILPSLKTESTGHVTVTYYPKNVDGPLVINALKEGGFQFEKGKEKNQLATNAIWVGDSVTLDQTKFVALTLIRAGVGIVDIRRFPDNSDQKEFLIEVGADPLLVGKKPMTVEGINSLTQIPARSANANEPSH